MDRSLRIERVAKAIHRASLSHPGTEQIGWERSDHDYKRNVIASACMVMAAIEEIEATKEDPRSLPVCGDFMKDPVTSDDADVAEAAVATKRKKGRTQKPGTFRRKKAATIIAIKRDLRDGLRVCEVAERHGVLQQYVSDIKSGKMWSDITIPEGT